MHKTLIIAEAGVNHNGSLEMAFALCDAAKIAGADAVKFQTFVVENLLAGTVSTADYQKRHTQITSQYDMLKKLELSFDDFRKLKAHCDAIGILFLSTPDDPDSLALLREMGVNPIKVGSSEVNNIPYLRQIGATQADVILSTGMASLLEVERACKELRLAGATTITLLQCTTNYPCALENVNLRAMLTLKEKFGFPVGFSDHTKGHLASVAAVSMGASVIEKHFTLNSLQEGPDHQASLDPKEFRLMVDAIRNTETLLGTGEKSPRDSERDVMRVVRRRIVAAEPIAIGELFTEKNLITKRSNKGIDAGQWDAVIGQSASKNYQKDEGIDF